MTTFPIPAARRRLWLRAATSVLIVAAAGVLVAFHLRHDRRVRAAESAERAGEFAAALSTLKPLLSAAHDDPELNLLAARAKWRDCLAEPFPAGWERAAERHLDLALAAPHLVGRASGDRDALSALNGDRAALRRLERRAALGGPDTPVYLEAIARCHLDAHRPGDVITSVGRLLELTPGRAPAHFWRALAIELAGGIYGQAEADFRRAVELDPARPSYRRNLALHLLGRNAALSEARQLFDDLRREAPDDPEVLRGLGMVLLRSDPAAAVPVLVRLSELRPADGDVLTLLGQAQMEAGRFAEAESNLRAGVARAAGSYHANFQLYRLLAATGRATEGEPFKKVADQLSLDFDRMTALSVEVTARPADPAPRTELGRLHLRVGSVALGAYWLETALTADAKYEPARKALAELAARKK